VLTSEFDYRLPEELIAQEPIEPRDASRMLVVHRAEDRMEHRHFYDIVEYLRPGDVLVANETRVIPARLQAFKAPSGGRVELLLLSRHNDLLWEALVKGRRVAEGHRLELRDQGGRALVAATVEAVTPSGGRLLRFEAPIDTLVDQLGATPLPPYIHRPLDDPERYQTVYARVRGSAAAPTAGLHFTPELMARVGEMGVEWVSVLLHIGLDTFRPVTEEVVEEHRIHTEYCHLSEEAAQRLRRARAEGRRIVAVGTTSVRVLETAAQSGEIEAWDGPTALYIYPGYRFRAVDALITNFHLPRSSLLMLISAFAGTDRVQQAYAEAVRRRYRFYSLGDAMLIV
jgi:S-adenosylmethionine:tRNA ribosyltransferase-isomerase